VAAPHHDFVNGPLRPIACRRELALLDGALDENVVSLLEGHRDAREVAVERQAVPVSVLLLLASSVLVSVALAETDVGDGCSRSKASDGGFGRQVPNNFETISLHIYFAPCST
jgi:hypothetical protein